MKKKNILFICSYELYYNPRIIKAADYFINKDWEVTIYAPYTGMIERHKYDFFLNSRKWNIIELDISKTNFKSYLSWLYVSIIQLFFKYLSNYFNINTVYSHLLNKSIYLFRLKNKKFDIVYINLIDNLLLVNSLKKNGIVEKVIFDSQEYFKGQYSKNTSIYKWVDFVEKKCIKNVDILCATTNVMKLKLESEFDEINCIRLRNLPNNKNSNFVVNTKKNKLSIIWHGLSINYNSRGINIIIEAISKCNVPVKLYLQGKINSVQKEIINNSLIKLNAQDKVEFREPAEPDNIVSSLLSYDIGIIGELPLEENQILTSSNKLFDYIQAGLCVVSSDMPGIIETFNEFNIGLLYKSGNIMDLIQKIEFLYFNQDQLIMYKENSKIASNELLWNTDFDAVFKKVIS